MKYSIPTSQFSDKRFPPVAGGHVYAHAAEDAGYHGGAGEAGDESSRGRRRDQVRGGQYDVLVNY